MLYLAIKPKDSGTLVKVTLAVKLFCVDMLQSSIRSTGLARFAIAKILQCSVYYIVQQL